MTEDLLFLLVHIYDIEAKVVEELGRVTFYLRSSHPFIVREFINHAENVRPTGTVFAYGWLNWWELPFSNFKFVSKT